ncbi:TVP38/TMEM64 family protein [Aerococcaceae bacterium WGS1372]
MTTRQKDIQFFKRNKTVLKWVAIIGAIITIIIFFFFVRIDLFNRPELIQHQLERTGILAPVVYFLVSIVNTIYPIIPGGLGNVIGYTVFGAVHGMILSFSANLIGSMILFYITKRFGRPILYAFADERLVKKSLSYLDRGINMNWILAIVFIVPGLPDDIFTMIAGLSGMTYKHIILLQLLFKPVTMFLYMAGINNLFVLLSEWL